MSYSWIDKERLAPNTLYRLSQTDLNGIEKELAVASPICKTNGIQISSMTHETGGLMVNIQTDRSEHHMIQVMDASGKVIFANSINLLKRFE